MARPFIVTGTPRSGTAWLAAFLSTGKVHCSHEILWTSDSWASFYSEFFKHECVGTVDSGLLHYIDGIVVDLNPKILLLRRNVEEVLVSFEKLQVPAAAIEKKLRETVTLLERWAAKPGVMTIEYPQLHDPLVMEKVWAHLTGDIEPFPRERHARMVTQRIERDVEELWAIARQACARGFPPRPGRLNS